ncbi:MAG: hypothetical protein WC756_07160 [Taibaiella sp.]|jgi:hypothetical protein
MFIFKSPEVKVKMDFTGFLPLEHLVENGLGGWNLKGDTRIMNLKFSYLDGEMMLNQEGNETSSDMEQERSEQNKRKTDLLEKELAFHSSMSLKIARSMNRLQKRIVCWTVILGVGTSIAAVYYLLEILKFFLCHPTKSN